jgi:aminotransferase EvaB
MSGYAQFGGREGDLPETEKAAREVFSLPMYPALTDSEQQRVSEALHEVLRELD